MMNTREVTYLSQAGFQHWQTFCSQY